ncbi:MAG TPA: hypothetical protein PLL21_00705 [Sedimentibacter sp.]|nr:hypothetical protein [Sedimentibacter sp.]
MTMILSVEIDNNIKIIEASKKGKELSVLRCMSIDTACVKDGKIIDMEGAVKIINEELKRSEVKTRKAYFVINSTEIMIRTIKLPFLKKNSDILSMLQIELQQRISADLSKYKIIYEVSNVTDENKIQYAEYIVYCVPLILIGQYIELAAKLKLKLLKIDISLNCINALYKNNFKINDVVLNNSEIISFFNVSKNSVSFAVANNGLCDFHISSEFENNYIEKSAEPHSQHGYWEVATDDDLFAALIAKFMRCYYSVSGNRSIDKMYIYGSFNQKYKEAIKTKLNLSSEVISTVSDLTVEIPDNFELSKYFNTFLMLLCNNKNLDLNTDRKLKFKNKCRYAAILLIIAAASTALSGFFNSQAVMRNEVTAMSSYIDDGENNQIYSVIEGIKNETDYLKFYLQQAQELKAAAAANDYVDTNILREVYRIKPFETRVTSIYSGRDSTQLLCLSPSMSEAALFFSDLKEIEQVKSAYMPAVQSKSGEPFSYSIVLKLKEVSSEE